MPSVNLKTVLHTKNAVLITVVSSECFEVLAHH